MILLLLMTMAATAKPKNIYSIDGERVRLHLHEGQQRAWVSERRFVFMIAGTQGGKTSFGPWWLWREIQRRNGGDFLAVTSSFDLFKLKMLPEMRAVYEGVLGIGRYWSGDKIIEVKNPETGKFEANRADDPMWCRIILRSAQAKGGLESATARGAWLDEPGQDEFDLSAWEAVQRRLSLSEGRVLGTTTPYNLGWLKQKIFDPWEKGDKDIDVIQFASTKNPIFPQAEFDRARRTLPAWKFNMFYRALFEKPAGMIYKDFIDLYRDKGGHKVKPFEIPRHWIRFVGVDPGAVHQAKIWAALDTETATLYIYRESLEGGKSTPEHAREAAELAMQNGERVVVWAVGQKSEVQQRLDWQAAGVPNVVEPPFHDVESGIDRIIALLRQHQIYFFDTLELTLDELGRYARKLDDAGEPTEAIKDKETFHLLDALRYLCAIVTEGPEREETIYDNSTRVSIGW